MTNRTWEQALEQMERELFAPIAEVPAWAEELPSDPIPVHLVQRAQNLLAAQQQRMSALRIEADRTRDQLAILDLVPDDRGTTAAYLDVVA